MRTKMPHCNKLGYILGMWNLILWQFLNSDCALAYMTLYLQYLDLHKFGVTRFPNIVGLFFV